MLGQNIKFLRTTKGLSQDGLCEEINNLFPSTAKFYKGRLSKWERSIEEPKLSAVKMIADYFKVTVDDLANKDLSIENFDTNTTNILPIYKQLETPRQTKVYSYAEKQLEEQTKLKTVKVYGQTAAGDPITYGDDIVEEKEASYIPSGADIALVVKGDSMEPEIEDGSIVFYKRQPNIENGEIAVVEIDGNGVTCKKVKFDYDNEKIILQSLNDKYEDQEFESTQIRILGKVVK